MVEVPDWDAADVGETVAVLDGEAPTLKLAEGVIELVPEWEIEPEVE
jgi:hypothetical protein